MCTSAAIETLGCSNNMCIHVQLPELVEQIQTALRSHAATARTFNFRHLVLQHHAATGSLEGCIDTVLSFTRRALVPITPVTEVSDDCRLQVYWLSASMPPANPTHVSFRRSSAPYACLQAYSQRRLHAGSALPCPKRFVLLSPNMWRFCRVLHDTHLHATDSDKLQVPR
jgi:hypothetical protein